MTTIRRFDPFRELPRLNRLLPTPFPTPFPAPFLPAAGWGSPFAPAGEPAAAAWGIPMDVRRSAGRLTLTASLPGFAPDEVDVSITSDRILTVKAARQAETEEQPGGGEYLLRERRGGCRQRALRLPADLDLDAAAVTLANGILTVTIPAAEAAQTRKLPIANTPAVDAEAAAAA